MNKSRIAYKFCLNSAIPLLAGVVALAQVPGSGSPQQPVCRASNRRQARQREIREPDRALIRELRRPARTLLRGPLCRKPLRAAIRRCNSNNLPNKIAKQRCETVCAEVVADQPQMADHGSILWRNGSMFLHQRSFKEGQKGIASSRTLR